MMAIYSATVEPPCEWATSSTLRCARVCTIAIRVPLPWAPASDHEPKLTLRAMMVGHKVFSETVPEWSR